MMTWVPAEGKFSRTAVEGLRNRRRAPWFPPLGTAPDEDGHPPATP